MSIVKSLFSGSLGIFGILLGLVLFFGPLAISIYGLVLAFKVGVLFGVLTLFIEPAPLFFGLCGLFGHSEVVLKIATAIGLN